jgi:hypothetical protein
MLILTLCLAPASAQASSFDGRPKILLHITGTTLKNVCSYGQLADCAAATTTALLTSLSEGNYYFVYLIGVRGSLETIGGIKGGIEFEQNRLTDDNNGQGIDILGWTLCGDLHLHSNGGENANSWPEAMSDFLVTWSFISCSDLDNKVAGYFYLAAYSDDTMRITASHRPDHGINAQMASCANDIFTFESTDLGSVAFSNESSTRGCNPCSVPCEEAIATIQTTWGAIKSLE